MTTSTRRCVGAGAGPASALGLLIASSSDDDSSSNGLAVAALAAGLGGLALGGVALSRSGKTSKS